VQPGAPANPKLVPMPVPTSDAVPPTPPAVLKTPGPPPKK
jgi:hypothetical protein